MDPTVTKGNIFTCKGAQNHVTSEMWKGTIRKELRIERQWKNSYSKQSIERERDFISSMNESLSEERISRKEQLPPLGRKELLKLHRENGQSGRMPTASRDVGRLSERANDIMALDRLSTPSGFGKKPIIMSSFFRSGGVGL